MDCLAYLTYLFRERPPRPVWDYEGLPDALVRQIMEFLPLVDVFGLRAVHPRFRRSIDALLIYRNSFLREFRLMVSFRHGVPYGGICWGGERIYWNCHYLNSVFTLMLWIQLKASFGETYAVQVCFTSGEWVGWSTPMYKGHAVRTREGYADKKGNVRWEKWGCSSPYNQRVARFRKMLGL